MSQVTELRRVEEPCWRQRILVSLSFKICINSGKLSYMRMRRYGCSLDAYVSAEVLWTFYELFLFLSCTIKWNSIWPLFTTNSHALVHKHYPFLWGNQGAKTQHVHSAEAVGNVLIGVFNILSVFGCFSASWCRQCHWQEQENLNCHVEEDEQEQMDCWISNFSSCPCNNFHTIFQAFLTSNGSWHCLGYVQFLCLSMCIPYVLLLIILLSTVLGIITLTVILLLGALNKYACWIMHPLVLLLLLYCYVQ